MKKLIFILLLIPVGLFGQQTLKQNLTIYKSTPTLNLYGSGGVINFNNGNVLITHTTDTLTLTGALNASKRISYNKSVLIAASDTAAMLSHYIHRADTAAMLANYLRKINMPIIGDTTVAAAYGKIVFKQSDSTLYVCKYIRPTGKKKWFKLDN